MNNHPLDDALHQAWDDSSRAAAGSAPSFDALAGRVRRRKRAAVARRGGVTLLAAGALAAGGLGAASLLPSDPNPGATATAPSPTPTPSATPTPAASPEPVAVHGPPGSANVLLMVDDPEPDGGGDAELVSVLLAHASADGKRIELVPISPRTTAAVPDCAHADGTTVAGADGTFQDAYAHGASGGEPSDAAACVAATFEQATGIAVDGWNLASLDDYAANVDALGGVDMCFMDGYTVAATGERFPRGPQAIDGDQMSVLFSPVPDDESDAASEKRRLETVAGLYAWPMSDTLGNLDASTPAGAATIAELSGRGVSEGLLADDDAIVDALGSLVQPIRAATIGVPLPLEDGPDGVSWPTETYEEFARIQRDEWPPVWALGFGC